jgi:hypothetical protein
MKQNRILTLLLAGLLLSSAFVVSQITPVSPAPVPYASVSELNGLLATLEQASQTTQTDLGRLRIERWKMDSGYKKETLGNVDSLKRNLQSALPEIATQLRNSPEDLGASFKLYRNLDALYDVLGNVAESAGAFGSKDEFQSLSNDLNAFERSRRAFADRMENLSNAKEAELAQLRTQVKTLQAAAAPPPPPKKIIIDDNAPPKPAPKKKKPVPKPPSATTPSTTPSSANPSPSQTKPQ